MKRLRSWLHARKQAEDIEARQKSPNLEVAALWLCVRFVDSRRAAALCLQV